MSRNRTLKLFYCIGALGFIATYVFYQYEIEKLKFQYRENQKLITTSEIEHISAKFEQLYQGLRTIARLPGVRKIDRYAKNFSPDARRTVQEIYNNLNSNIKMSEVYLVPVGFEPERMDPNTKKKEAPITTFDEVILGKTASEHEEHIEVEEIEIYEYRLMKEHLRELAKTVPMESSGKGYEIPMITGPEVITCDNSRFDPKNPRDKDRSGLVFSVPFYGEDGKLKGMVSGVVLSSVMSEYLVNKNFSLLNVKYGYLAHKESQGAELKTEPIYSDTVNLKEDGWQLRVVKSESEFWSSSEVKSFQWIFFTIVIALCVVSITVIKFLELKIRETQVEKERSEQLQKQVDEQVKVITATQAELVQKSKLSSLGVMAGGIAHEINNPLAIIQGNATLLKSRIEKNTDAVVELKQIDKILKTTERIAKIVRGLKSISRDGGGDPFISTDLKTIIDDAVTLCESKLANAQIMLRLNVQSGLFVETRAVQISQVILNLVQNSADAIIDLTEKWIEINAIDEGSVVRIEVTDSGTGIPSDIAEKLMQPFFTTKEIGKGTGLGLSISKGIIETHNGLLQLDTSCKNTRFVIQLPKTQPQESQQFAA